MLSFHVKFVQTDRGMDRRTVVKQYAPNFLIRGYKNLVIRILSDRFLGTFMTEMLGIWDTAWLIRLLAHLSTTCSRGAFRVVRCLSCVVPNRWANLDQNWQECSLGGLLQKLFTEFDSIKNSGCYGNEIEFFKQFLKNLLLRNLWSDFKIISQECSLGDPFQKVFAKF